MKFTSSVLNILFVILLTAAPAEGDTTVLVSSFDKLSPTNTRAILRADGSVIEGELLDTAEGVISIGYFDFAHDPANMSSDSDIANMQESLTSADAALLGSAWVQFGTSAKMGPGFNLDSTYDFTSTDNLAAGSPFIGRHAYTFIGNGLSYATSTEFLVMNHNVEFTLEAPIGGPALLSLTESIGTGTLLLGHFGTSPHSVQPGNVLVNTSTGLSPGLDAFGLESIQVVSVPEPSSLLIAFAGLGIFFPRRRK